MVLHTSSEHLPPQHPFLDYIQLIGMGPTVVVPGSERLLKAVRAFGDREYPSFLPTPAPDVPDRTQRLLQRKECVSVLRARGDEVGPDSPEVQAVAEEERVVVESIASYIKAGKAYFEALQHELRDEDRVRRHARLLVGMLCNTAHAFFEGIEEECTMLNERTKDRKKEGTGGVEVKLLHMPREVARYAREKKISRMGVLSTTGTRAAGIYTEALEAKNVQPVYVDETVQDELHRLIYEEIKNASGSPDSAVTERLTAMIAELKRQHDIEAVVLGCTELLLAFRSAFQQTSAPMIAGVRVIEPMDVLVRRMLVMSSHNGKGIRRRTDMAC